MRSAAPRGTRSAGAQAKTGWAALAGAVLVVACCAALPLLAGVVGSLALGAMLGVGAGVLVLALLAVLVLLRARRRLACRPEATRKPTA